MGRDLPNRAAVPSTLDKANRADNGLQKRWSVGALGINTACLYAPANGEEDGECLVSPPAVLQKVGVSAVRRFVETENMMQASCRNTAHSGLREAGSLGETRRQLTRNLGASTITDVPGVTW